MSGPRLIILDFDGTFTNVDEEAIPFLAEYRRGFETLIGQPVDEVWAAAQATVQKDPDAHGFSFEGRIVAPSHADPYILATSVAHLVLAELGIEDRAPGLEGLFKSAYAASATVFRPDAGDVLDALLARGGPMYVVSNSHTESVRTKLTRLRPNVLETLPVIGNARKFFLVAPDPPDARFEAVPEAMDVEHLARPVYLRRGLYYEQLRRIWQETGVEPNQTLVCGDIFELDLALPAALGATVCLVGRERTPRWEREAVEKVGGRFTTALSGVL